MSTTRTIEEEIKQDRFEHFEERVFVDLMLTTNVFAHRVARYLKQFDGLTIQQFNILRILKGQQGTPLSLQDVKCRMFDRNSDVSRIIDRLVKKGYINREACKEDRRQVDLTITPAGLELISQVGSVPDETLEAITQFGENKGQKLTDLLDEMRGLLADCKNI